MGELMRTTNQRVEDTGLASVTSGSTELAPTRTAAAEQFEIQSAVVLARRFPRNEDQAFAALMKACSRSSFAEDAEYSFPRGDKEVTGASVYLAREAARVWGNIRYGLTLLRDDEDSRDIEGWAWDLETNTKTTAQDSFRKLVQRKRDGKTKWVPADERDLRELTNRRGAILVRNCILQLLPSDLIDDAISKSRETVEKRAQQDPDGERKKILLAFGSIGVTPEMLGAYLKHTLVQCSPAEIANLRAIFKSIRDGNSTWDEYVNGGTASTNGSSRTVGMPKAKASESAVAPGEDLGDVPEHELLALGKLADEHEIPPMAVTDASMRMFAKPPAKLSPTEFGVLKGWVENGGQEK
jgi:hypothetical protein